MPCFSKKYLLAAGFLLMMAVPSLSSAAEAGAESLYPSFQTLFSPRVYGMDSAPDKLTLFLSPADHQSRDFYLASYDDLMEMISSGRARVEIKLFGFNMINLPTNIVARCLPNEAMPLFLKEIFERQTQIPNAKQGVSAALVDLALSKPEFFVKGFGSNEMRRRLNWCLSFRREALVWTETERYQETYKWDLPNERPRWTIPIAVLNDQKVFGNIQTLAPIQEALESQKTEQE